MKSNKAITLISLIVTIVILIILAGITMCITLGENGILNKTYIAKEETNKQTATEKLNLKITKKQMNDYSEKQIFPNLQDLADFLCEDKEIEYVTTSSKVSSIDKIVVGNASSIFTKLKQYPYEFEINSSLQLASIDGTKIENTNSSSSAYKVGTYNTVSVSAGDSILANMKKANTIEINIKDVYKNYSKLTKDNFLSVDSLSFVSNDSSSQYISYGSFSTEILSYDSTTGLLTIIKPFAFRDDAANSYDACFLGSVTIYIVENITQ